MSLLPRLSQHTKPGTILRWSDLSASDGFDNYQVFGSLVTPPSPDNPCECTVRFSNGMATMSLHHLANRCGYQLLPATGMWLKRYSGLLRLHAALRPSCWRIPAAPRELCT